MVSPLKGSNIDLVNLSFYFGVLYASWKGLFAII